MKVCLAGITKRPMKSLMVKLQKGPRNSGSVEESVDPKEFGLFKMEEFGLGPEKV